MTGHPRLMLLTTSLDRGGAQRQVVDLAKRFRSGGWPVVVVSMIDPAEYVDELVEADVEVMTLGMRPGRPTPLALLRYGRTLRAWAPDIVHAHMVHANLLARIGRVFGPRVPVICTVHNVQEGARWREVAYRLTDPGATITTAVSAAAAERYVRVGAVPRGRIRVVVNGYAPSGPVPAPRSSVRRSLGVSDAFLWLSVGRLVPAKGFDLLIEAFAVVIADRPSMRLVIAGDGPERDALQSAIVSAGLADTITLLGDRSDVPALLGAADGFVLPSRWEGLPMVLLEAAAQGLPIVATDVGGSRQAADPAAGAIITEPTIESIAAGMSALSAMTPRTRAAVGARLRAHVLSTFDMDMVVARWEAIYAWAMGRHGPTTPTVASPDA